MANLGGHFNAGNAAIGTKARAVGFKGEYKTVLSKTYKNLTEQEADLRVAYGKSLVSHFLQITPDFITMKQLSYEQTSTSVNEVYGISLTAKAYGKLSIRAQITPRGYTLYFILQKKAGATSKIKQFHGYSNVSAKQRNRETKRQGSRSSEKRNY